MNVQLITVLSHSEDLLFTGSLPGCTGLLVLLGLIYQLLILIPGQIEYYLKSPFFTHVFQGTYMFSSSSLNIFGFPMKSLIHFELIFEQGNRYRYSFNSSTCGHPVFPAPFPKYAVLAFLSSIRCLQFCELMFGSSLASPWSTCLFLCQCRVIYSNKVP